MTEAEVVRTPEDLGGEPRLAGRRISVIQVADLVLEAGHSVEWVADQLDVSLPAVHTALAYYYANPEEMDRVRDRHEELEERLREQATAPDQPRP